MFCVNCGKEITDNARFCDACGAYVVDAAPDQAAKKPAGPAENMYTPPPQGAVPPPAGSQGMGQGQQGSNNAQQGGYSQPGNNYNAPPPNYNQNNNYNNNSYYADDPGSWKVGAFFLAFFLTPIIGFILYLVWKDQYPNKAAAVGKGTLWGFITSIILGVVGGIILACASALTINGGYYIITALSMLF